jgi:hypothetical protein
MRPALLVWALAVISTTTNALPATRDDVVAEEALQGETPAKGGEAVKYTTFNGIQVPPMMEIEGDKFKETIAEGYW